MAGGDVRLLFVCTGNTGRSMMATALTSARICSENLAIAVSGRGLSQNPLETAPEVHMAALLLQRGIDVSSHRAEQLTVNDVRHADLVITMTTKHRDAIVALYPEARAKTHTIAQYATGHAEDVADAYGKPMEVYERVFDQISRYLPAVLARALRQ